MSVRIMTRAWMIDISPSLKLMLMALADNANDCGICWPSVGVLAEKCCLNNRTARRLISELESRGHIRIERRFRANGSQSSNRYVILPNGGGDDKLSGGSQANSPDGRTPHSGGVTGDSPLNHQPEPSQEPPQTSGSYEALVYPGGLTAVERAEAAPRLAGLSTNIAQQILFELDGRMKVGEVKNPLRYLSALIASAKSGKFRPELALRVQEAHKRSIAMAAEIALEDAAREASLPPINLNALSPRLREIVQKHVKRAADITGEPPNQSGDG